MHVLITGGAGFIGSHLAEYHINKGDKVHVIDDLSTGLAENISFLLPAPGFHFDEADILTWPGLEKAVTWADRIYHMAAVVGVLKVLTDPVAVLSVNIAGCERLLGAAHAGNWNPHIILASTSEVYGRGLHCRSTLVSGEFSALNLTGSSCPPNYRATAFSEDLEPMVGSSAISRWNYSISKLADEAFALSYARAFGMNVTVIRLFNTIGPRQTGRYGMVVPRFVAQAVGGEPVTVYGDGSQSRCFCDVRDTVEALDRLAGNPASMGQIVNVGNDRLISIKRLAELVIKKANSRSAIRFVPYKEAYGEDFDEVYYRRPDLEKLLKLTGFKFKWTLEDTLGDLVERHRRSI